MSFRPALARNIGVLTRTTFRPAVIRQLPRRNFTVGLQPGIEEQQIAHEAAAAIKMVALYFGMMGASFAVGGVGGAVIANRENEAARAELRDEFASVMIDQLTRDGKAGRTYG